MVGLLRRLAVTTFDIYLLLILHQLLLLLIQDLVNKRHVDVWSAANLV